MATPSPTPYSTTKYDVSTGADGFHNLPGRADNEFSFEESYYVGVFVSAGVHLVLLFIAIFGYWIFLCGRSGCCSCFCNSCCLCKIFDYLFCGLCYICPCFGKQKCCCPDIDIATDEESKRIEGKGPCLCPKDSKARMHNGCLIKREGSHDYMSAAKSRFIVGAIAISCFSINIGVMVGKASLEDAIDSLAQAMYDLADVFDDLLDSADAGSPSMYSVGASMYSYADTVSKTCAWTQTKAYGSSLKIYGGAIRDVGSSMATAIGDIPDDINDFGDTIDDFGTTYMSYSSVGAVLLLGTIFASLVLVGSLIPECNILCCSTASNLLALANIVGVISLFVMAIFVFIELAFGMIIGDFCYGGPGASLGILANNVNSTSPFFSKILTYYSSCQGNNPFQGYYNDATSNFALASSTIATASNEVLNLDLSCSATAFNAYDAAAKSLGVNDETNPLYNMFQAIGCSALNPVLAKAIDDAMCTHFIDGFYVLFATHAAVLVFTYIAMILISFMRRDIQEAAAKNKTTPAIEGAEGQNFESVSKGG